MAKAILEFAAFRLELEGGEEFVEAQLVAWADRIPGTIPREAPAQDKESSAGTPEDEPVGGEGTARKQKRGGAKSGGPSCASRIRELIAEDYFKASKKVPDISDRLKEKATPYEPKHIAAALIHTVQAGRLRRVRDGGVWSYVNP